jgi:GH15 family glucan-1,4-alpha-glucosidase
VRLERYALIGDCETAALVGDRGSIDWLCWPDFSSPACFAALLGTKNNGRWIITPKHDLKRVTRKYRDHTLILETTFETASGVVRLTDFMPVRERHSDVVRIVRCLHGFVAMQMELCIRFDYGRTIPWTGPWKGNEWTAAAGTGSIYLRTRQRLRTEDSIAYADFVLHAGEQRSFTLTYVSAPEPPPRRVNTQIALRQTERYWTEWCRQSHYRGPWKDIVERSLITVKALTYRPTGGIVAAPTTSLPERIGGNRNWDYRYCWLRDASMMLESLLLVGYHAEAKAWEQWLLQSVGSDVRQMQIMYGMHGERHLPECELPWLRGYHESGPVRIGNAASEQLQLDVYGEVADAIATMARAKLRLDPRLRSLHEQITGYVASIADKPASGMWEQRGIHRQFTYSKVMAWIALDHGVKAAETGVINGPVAEWKRTRDRLRREILKHGFNRRLGSFVQSYHSARLDAATLLIPIFGFLRPEDEHVRGTVRAVGKHLMRDGLIYRYQSQRGKEGEAAFLPCSFWYAQNLALAGRRVEAEKYFEKLLRLTSDVGLLSEEYSPRENQFLGNFPQALTHIALISAARALT